MGSNVLKHNTPSSTGDRLRHVLVCRGGGEEYNTSPQPLRLGDLEHLNARETRHVDVEHSQIWLELPKAVEGFGAVRAGCHDLEIGAGPQQSFESTQDNRMIVG